ESQELPGPWIQIPRASALRGRGIERQIVSERHQRIDAETGSDPSPTGAELVEVGEAEGVAELMAVGPVRVVARPVVVLAVHGVEEAAHPAEENPRQAVGAARRRASLVDGDPRLVG